MSRVQIQVTVDGKPWETFDADDDQQCWIDSTGARLTTAEMFAVLTDEGWHRIEGHSSLCRCPVCH